mmetsp:Transcript_96327/g.311028  ORF Transcript_96327/g.311028 Transcript_96327/m.311028 type:complete len:407 (+) Transcript_96327:714-1934(+)
MPSATRSGRSPQAAAPESSARRALISASAASSAALSSLSRAAANCICCWCWASTLMLARSAAAASFARFSARRSASRRSLPDTMPASFASAASARCLAARASSFSRHSRLSAALATSLKALCSNSLWASWNSLPTRSSVCFTSLARSAAIREKQSCRRRSSALRRSATASVLSRWCCKSSCASRSILSMLALCLRSSSAVACLHSSVASSLSAAHCRPHSSAASSLSATQLSLAAEAAPAEPSGGRGSSAWGASASTVFGAAASGSSGAWGGSRAACESAAQLWAHWSSMYAAFVVHSPFAAQSLQNWLRSSKTAALATTAESNNTAMLGNAAGEVRYLARHGAAAAFNLSGSTGQADLSDKRRGVHMMPKPPHSSSIPMLCEPQSEVMFTPAMASEALPTGSSPP